MRIFLCFFLVLLTLASYSQDTSNKSDLQTELDRMKIRRDSLTRLSDSAMIKSLEAMNKRELQRSLEQNERNLNAFMAEQREREKKQTRNLWIRGGLMLLVIGLLIFRFVKKKKPKTNTQA